MTSATMTRPRVTDEQKAECRNELLKMLNPGSVLYVVHVNTSRKTVVRQLKIITVYDGKPVSLGHLIAPLLGLRLVAHNGTVKVTAQGMEASAFVANSLSHNLFQSGGKLFYQLL